MAVILNLLFALTLAIQTIAATPAQPEKNQNGRFAVAVLRHDGTVIPFAAFDGKNWTSPWPTDLRFVEIPIGTESISDKWWGKAGPISVMTVWIHGVSRGQIRLSRPIVLPVMCGTRLGMVTDYAFAQRVALPFEQPYPKDGLAVSGEQTVEAIEELSDKSSEWKTMAESLREPVAKAEQTAIAAFTDWKDPIPRSTRRATAVEIEAMYRAPMDTPGWVAYYIEAIKRYAPGPDDEDCGLVTSSNGWVYVDPKGKQRASFTARVTYCDRRGVTYMLPLGLIKAHDRTYWVYQLSGYGREGYAITRPTPKTLEMQVQYPAANCPILNAP